MNEPKISVIVPVYNVELYLRECLDSIVHQTHQNLEIILVDDGSTDQSRAICDEYAATDSRISVIHHENRGAAAARNTGLDVATGDWIGFVDSDDYIEPDLYEYLLALIQHTGADIAQCGMVYETDRKRWVSATATRETCVDVQHIMDASRFYSNSNCCKIFRTSKVQKIRFERYLIGEDFFFNLLAIQKANKIVFGTQAKYHYIQHSDSTCNGVPSQRALVSFRKMLQDAIQEFSNEEAIVRLCTQLLLRNNLDICSKVVRYRMEAENSRLVREMQDELRKLTQKRFVGIDFSAKEKAKVFLIAYCWPLYKRMILTLKGDNIRQYLST